MAKPLTLHWADQTAARIVNQLGERDLYTVASGITPSGTVHIGNFREVITVDLVARALRSLGKNVRFIFSWDDFDTLRKVPTNLPQQDMLSNNLRRPISRVPDPYGEHESYAAGGIKSFERQLVEAGCQPEFLYQHQRYAAGLYSDSIRKALEHTQTIKKILDQHRREPLSDDWLPTSIYCEQCDRDQMTYERYDGDWSYSYQCASCGHAATTDIRTSQNLKLNWRTDWPMRWAYEQVDFEPGGKDHSSQGGSYDTAKEIVRDVYGCTAPIYLQYDFVSIKGLDGKMSSSAGVLIRLADALQVYDGQMVRWIFACHRPNHDFALAFDSDVIKIYDEFDRAEAQALNPPAEDPKGRWALLRRNYELAMIDGQVPAKQPFRPSFRDLCTRLQICGGDIERTRQRFYREATTSKTDQDAYVARAQRAWFWLQNHAPDEFRYSLNTAPHEIPLSPAVAAGLGLLKTLVERTDLDQIDAKELNQLIYDEVIRGSGCDAKEFFRATYQKLISRDQGPRLPGFLKEIGRDKILPLLSDVR